MMTRTSLVGLSVVAALLGASRDAGAKCAPSPTIVQPRGGALPLHADILVFVPAFFLLLYGYALNFDIRHIALAVQDRDGTPESRAVVSAFVNSSYFDLVAAYTMSDVAMFSNVTGRLGINNVLDKDPPLIGQDSCPGVFCNGNTFPQVYDTLGRFVFLGLTADF